MATWGHARVQQFGMPHGLRGYTVAQRVGVDVGSDQVQEKPEPAGGRGRKPRGHGRKTCWVQWHALGEYVQHGCDVADPAAQFRAVHEIHACPDSTFDVDEASPLLSTGDRSADAPALRIDSQ